MEDKYGKYIRLFGTLFFTLLGLLIVFILLLLGLRLVFGILSFIPWSSYIYTVFIIAVPALLFTTVFIIYLKRSTIYPVVSVRYISYAIFIIFLALWCFFIVKDIITYSKTGSADIDHYYSYSKIFLVANVAAIFLVGVMQALAAPVEKDWMKKYHDEKV